MIELNKVSKKYGSRVAVEALSFSVKKGEVLGFLGPNGAGKTTTMKMITGHMIPTSGSVKIDGEDIFENPLSTKKKIGYLPEIPPVYGDMYVDKYLHYVAALKQYPQDKIKSQVDSIIDQLGLQKVRNRLIQNISKGFKQRAGLAQALISNPEILVLDEPTVGLDPTQVLEMRNLIHQLKGQHTIILSSHILSEVQANCDRIIIIQDGKIIAHESMSSLRETQSQSRRQINVRVKNISDVLKQELKNLKGIQDICVASSSKITLSIDQDADPDLNEKIVLLVIQKSCGFIELTESFSLEDVFLNLTKEEK